MNFFEKKKKIKKISAGMCPAPPNVTPENLCLQGKLMPRTLHLATCICQYLEEAGFAS